MLRRNFLLGLAAIAMQPWNPLAIRKPLELKLDTWNELYWEEAINEWRGFPNSVITKLLYAPRIPDNS